MQMETERLLIREIAESDWQPIHTYTSMRDVTEHTAWGPNTEKDTQAYVRDVIRMQQVEPREGYELAIVLKKEDILIGGVGLHLVDQTNAEIGYVLHPAYQGNGYVTEACCALLQFGFRELGVHRIFATCRPENPASERVMQRIGMQREGLMREHWFYKGSYHDSVLYSMLDRELNKQKCT